MLKNFIKIASRNLLKQKLFSTINILSLAFGMAACLLIFLFIKDERSFDQFHQKKNQIFRLNEVQSFTGTNTQNVALSMPGMAPALEKDYPEVKNYSRFWNRGKRLFEWDNNQLVIKKTVAVDSSFLEIFDFQMIEGNPSEVLDDPYSIVLTEAIADKFFGQQEAINRTLKWGDRLFNVTGIIEDVPENSHLQFDVLLSMPTFILEDSTFNSRFGSNYLVSYLLMEPSTDIALFESKMPQFLLRYMPPDEDETDDVTDYYKIYYQTLSEVHLSSTNVEHDYQNYRKFNGEYLDIFSLVGIFILLIAGVNFMNLMTARASHRWKEVGIRKTVGALKYQLFTQFAVEAVMLGFFAFIIALIIDVIFVPILNEWIGRELSMKYYFDNPLLLITAFVITLLLGFLAGTYPSFYLASFDPSKILKGGIIKTNKSIFRSALVVLQFGLAIAMIVSTFMVVQQLFYIKNKDIGFNKDHIILIEMNQQANEKFEIIKSELMRSAHIVGVTASGQRLGNNFHQWGFKLRADTIIRVTPSNVNVDFDFFNVYEIDILKGRGFSKDYGMDRGGAFVINEAFAKEIGLEDIIGISAGHSWYDDDSLGTIVGISKDFHFNSLHYDINTLAMVVHPDWGYQEMSVKVDGNYMEEAIEEVERIWQNFVPTWPFTYTFLDEHFEELYRSEQQMQVVVSLMAVLAILIACMGLFGLSAITTERKIKEIGIRKILGANIGGIWIGLSKNFALLVMLAFALVTPVTYYFLSIWLEKFAYRVDMNVWIFLLGGMAALCIALATISYHVLRSARTNPAEALRYE